MSIAIKRLPDWRSRLSAYIEAVRREPFTEENNCGLFLANCVREMTGVDLAAPYRGKYKTRAEGIVLLRAEGYADLCAFLSAHFSEIPPLNARAGDVMAITSDETGWAGGIVNGERVTVMNPSGLATIERTQATRAFRVP